ncbi:MAG: YncE family protein [Bacteroidota bacterium]
MRLSFRLLYCFAIAALLGGTGTAFGGTLFIGTDTEEFQGLPASYLFKATVSGPNFVSEAAIPLTFPLNGIGDGPGFLYAGDPNTNGFRTVGYDGGLLTSTTGGFPSECCNEEMQFAGGNLYHAHWATNIQQINPVTGAVLLTFDQPDTVGMALVGSTIWITHWSAHQVGTWDPSTNTFTSMFTTPDNAGALAYDPGSNLLWVGQLGGNVIPYSLAGVAQGPGFNALAGFLPAGTSIDTVDGLTFQGEGTQTVPEPATIALLGLGLAGLGFSRRKRTN